MLRHPNIVKYLYSEEQQNLNINHSKCLLITESIRPLNSVIGSLSKDQIICGIFGITNALSFLHDKAFLSHNNISASCIYLNTKQVWKINDFELAMYFKDLNRENLKSIYEYKNKSAITPEEELEIMLNNNENLKSTLTRSKYYLDVIYKESPHSLDAYAWAMLVFQLLTRKDTKKSENNQSNGGSGSGSANPSSKMFYSFEHKESSASTANIMNDQEDDDKYCMEELEKFLNKDPMQRPTLIYALNLNLFDVYTSNGNMNTSNSIANSLNSSVHEFVENSSSVNPENDTFDPLKIDDLTQLEYNWPKLMAYLKNATQNNANILLNERLIDFLLSTFMFFSDKARRFIFPSIFIPKENRFSVNNNNNNNTRINLNYLKTFFLANENDLKDENMVLEPFISVDKYKAFVLPKILNLFSMRSSQIRIVLLEYFPFYITLVNDFDTLKYEILSEV